MRSPLVRSTTAVFPPRLCAVLSSGSVVNSAAANRSSAIAGSTIVCNTYKSSTRSTSCLMPDEREPSEQLDLGGLDTLLGFQLRMASAAVARDFARMMGDLGVTQKQY